MVEHSPKILASEEKVTTNTTQVTHNVTSLANFNLVLNITDTGRRTNVWRPAAQGLLSSDNYSSKFMVIVSVRNLFPFFQGVTKNSQWVTSNAMNLKIF